MTVVNGKTFYPVRDLGSPEFAVLGLASTHSEADVLTTRLVDEAHRRGFESPTVFYLRLDRENYGEPAWVFDWSHENLSSE